MNKRDLVSRVASRASLSQRQSAKAVDNMLEAIIAAVSAGESVKLSGFGTFDTQHRQPRRGRHPQTGAALKIPAKTVPSFSASRLFKSKVATDLHVLRIPPLCPASQRASTKSAAALVTDPRATSHRLRSITDRVRDFFKG
ncbi:MAG: HU family DNA-binding protein [Cyanobacteria bacterium J06632_22]